MIDNNFPSTHKRKGEQTHFYLKIAEFEKLHTIRGNYKLWKKRFNKIEKGLANLSVREWMGKPYFSKQRELFLLTNDDGIGIEKITFSSTGIMPVQYINEKLFLKPLNILAKNDGLKLNDFEEWFKNYDLSKPMAIIHFTDFRYDKINKFNF